MRIQAPPALSRLGGRLPEDPGLASLRRAARAAIIMPASFAFAKLVIGDIQTTTFVAFGCFAFLVMGDFGGTRRPRAIAYVMTAIVGAGLLTLGTLASSVGWGAVLAMFVVGFWVQFSGVFGGYVAAAQTALLLSFVLAVSVPVPAASVGHSLLGWAIAAAVSTLSAVFLWPRFERLVLRRKVGEACRALAEMVAAQRHRMQDSERDQSEAAAREAVEAARRQYRTTPKRPAGAAQRDRAIAELVTELEQTLHFATRPFRLELPRAHPCIEEGDKLAAAVVQTLDGAGAVLTAGDPPDLVKLNRVRAAHRQALDRWAGDALRSGTSPEEVLAGLDVDHSLRVVSFLSLAIGVNALIAAGRSLPDAIAIPAGTPGRSGAAGMFARIVETIRTYLSPRSSMLHQSLRVGMGLAAAVLLARLLNLEHAFWAVLGTLSVLRSNAFGTGRTTVQALAGTAVGVAGGALFTAAVGADTTVLWAVLPIAVFLAAYASRGAGFVLSQAAFSMLVIILFNVIAPVGWTVGIARLEDVAVGVGVSLVAGLLLWPRGARGELVNALSEWYRAASSFLAGSLARILEAGSEEDVGRDRSLAVRDRNRAGEAFDLWLYERGAKRLDPETAAFLVGGGTYALMAGDGLNVIADMGYQTNGSHDGMATIRAQGQLMLAGLLGLADRLEGKSSRFLSQANVSEAALRDSALSSLRWWANDPGVGREAMAAVMAGEWIQQMGELIDELQNPVAQAAQASRVPWWR